MKKIMKVVSCAVALALMIPASGVLAEKLKDDGSQQAPIITTGSKGKTYIKVGYNIRNLLERGTVVESRGGVENLDRLKAGKADIGLAPLDAYAYELSQDPNLSQSVEMMGPAYEECAYIAINPNGPIGDEDDLASEAITIAIGKKGAGDNHTWAYLRELNKGYQKAKVVYAGGVRALGKLAAQPDGDINAVIWVTKPDLSGKMAQTVLQNENLVFMDLNDRRLNNKHPELGRPIYEFKKIKSGTGMFGGSVKTVCTSAAVFARSDADEDTLDEIADIVMNYRSSIIPE